MASQRMRGIEVLKAVGEIDLGSAPVLADATDRALAGRPAAMVIDLSDVDFMASAGLEVLVKAYRTAAGNTKVVVVADGPATSRPIRLMGVDEVVPLYSVLDDAIAGLTDGEL
ncbi:STAS domain-containing protein [Mycobacterium parmense]|uniref:Anti-sigma factor antagonist n=1 Tax=Mycobacterium parmense TaxID=185642 RepID=A0A7I7YPW5_9MYCO|nr:STAS domain-containing protein [Mycobacterium parmense]BBZ43679.1 anti-sigma factor antagonist [Mycobacterium parmense]